MRSLQVSSPILNTLITNNASNAKHALVATQTNRVDNIFVVNKATKQARIPQYAVYILRLNQSTPRRCSIQQQKLELNPNFLRAAETNIVSNKWLFAQNSKR
jgi:hypothetical protein